MRSSVIRNGVALLVFAFASTALADRVSGTPPTDCPAGSYPDVDHGGPLCTFVRCTSDADCTWDSELHCGPVASLCIVTDEFNTYTRRPNRRERAAAACVDGACSEGECETKRFCVRGAPMETMQAAPMETAPVETAPVETMEAAMEAAPVETNQAASSSDESGCSAAGSTAGSLWVLLLLVRRRR